MKQELCENCTLLKPRYDIDKKELVIPCSRETAEQIVTLDRNFEYAKMGLVTYTSSSSCLPTITFNCKQCGTVVEIPACDKPEDVFAELYCMDCFKKRNCE